jgi:hypothetical protein
MKTKVCRRVREQLIRAEIGSRVSDSRHLEECPECAQFLVRLRAAQESLTTHQSQVIADPTFASRAVRALPVARNDMFGWAATRFLPAAAALVLTLGIWCWMATSTPRSLVEESPTDDLITWVLENGGEGS